MAEIDTELEEMLQEIKEKPSETKVGTVVHRGSEEAPAPMIVSSIEAGGKVEVYDTLTGEMSWVLYNEDTGGMLRQILKVKRDDGSRMFTLRKPPFEPIRGTLKCLLHPDGPNRKHYDEMGLPTCKKDNLTAPYMVGRHMHNRHPSAWAIIEQEKKDKEKEEDREYQKGIIDLAKGKPVESDERTCDICGKVCKGDFGLRTHQRSHK